MSKNETQMRTHLRHDLTDHALVGYARREGDDGGPLVAVWFDDEEAQVKVGLRIRTAAQADALVKAALAAQKALSAEHEYFRRAAIEHEAAATREEIERRRGFDRRITDRDDKPERREDWG